MASACWVGLDLGLETASVAAIDDRGSMLLAATCRADAREIATRLSAIPDAVVQMIGLEAGICVHLVREMRAMGLPVTVFEARKASRFLQVSRIKSDTTDARGLAELARVGGSVVSSVHVKGLECQNIRSRLMLRQRLMRQCQGLEALINSLVKLHGGDLRLGRNPRAVGYTLNREMLRLTRAGINTDEEVRPVLAIRQAMRDQITAIDKRIARDAGRNDVCQRLMTVPGIGPLTAMSFYSAVEEPTRFSNIAGIGPYLGLTPRMWQSGDMKRSGRISGFGNSFTRSTLVMAATTLLYHRGLDCPLRSWGRQVLSRIGPAKARVAVARKLAVLMLRIWKDGATFDPSAGMKPIRDT